MKSQPELVFSHDDFEHEQCMKLHALGGMILLAYCYRPGLHLLQKTKTRRHRYTTLHNTNIISLLSKENSVNGSLPERSGSCDPPSGTERVFVGGDKGDPLALQEAFCDATEAGKLDDIREFPKGDANLANSRKHGESAMVSAIHGGHEKIRRMLLDAKACSSYPDQPDSSPSDQIPLRQAIRCSNNNMVAILLNSGANVETRDDLSRTALFETLDCHDLNGADLLIRQGISISACDYLGTTVPHEGSRPQGRCSARFALH